MDFGTENMAARTDWQYPAAPIVLEELTSRCSKGLEDDLSPAANYHLNDNMAQINSSQSQFEDHR